MLPRICGRSRTSSRSSEVCRKPLGRCGQAIGIVGGVSRRRASLHEARGSRFEFQLKNWQGGGCSFAGPLLSKPRWELPAWKLGREIATRQHHSATSIQVCQSDLASSTRLSFAKMMCSLRTEQYCHAPTPRSDPPPARHGPNSSPSLPTNDRAASDPV